MTCPRLTIHRLMLLVAIAAVLLSGELARRRWAERAARYRQETEDARIIQAWYEGFGDPSMKDRLGKDQVDRARRAAEFQRELAEKYERAARYPWLSVTPTPPRPDDAP